MDLLIIIIAFLLAYGIFVLIAVKLARIFFPKVVDDEALDLKRERFVNAIQKERRPKGMFVNQTHQASTRRQAFFVCYLTSNIAPQWEISPLYQQIVNQTI